MQDSGTQAALARDAVNNLERLGPTFIKLGQIMSIRWVGWEAWWVCCRRGGGAEGRRGGRREGAQFGEGACRGSTAPGASGMQCALLPPLNDHRLVRSSPLQARRAAARGDVRAGQAAGQDRALFDCGGALLGCSYGWVTVAERKGGALQQADAGRQVLVLTPQQHQHNCPLWFPAATQARAAVEAELGAPIDELFSEFSEKPIAAASLAQASLLRACLDAGVTRLPLPLLCRVHNQLLMHAATAPPPPLQVYRARVRATGQEVAVKVQRPAALATISKVRPTAVPRRTAWPLFPGMRWASASAAAAATWRSSVPRPSHCSPQDLYVMRRAVGVYERLVRRFTAQTTDYQSLVSTFAEVSRM